MPAARNPQPRLASSQPSGPGPYQSRALRLAAGFEIGADRAISASAARSKQEALVRLPTRAGSAVPGGRVAAGDPRRLAAAERDRLDDTIVRRGRRVPAVEQQSPAVP